MRIDTSLNRDDIAPAMQWVATKFGGALDKRVKGFEQQRAKNPLLQSYYRETYPIEYALAESRRHYRLTGRFPFGSNFGRAYALVAALQRFAELLNPSALAQLDGRIRGAMKDEFGLRPLAYEVDTAVNLVRRGFDVEWTDLTGVASFDLRATKDATTIEIECKTTSADTGRKITRAGLHRLAGRLADRTRLIDRTGGVHLYQVTIPNRLDTNDAQIAALAELISKSMDHARDERSPSGRVIYRLLDSVAPSLSSEAEIRNYLEARSVRENCHIVWNERPGHGLIAMAVMSEEADTVAASVTARAMEAAKQLSGRNPAIVTLQLVEMSRAQLEILLKTPNTLHAAARRVFNRAAHIDSITYSVPIGSESINSHISAELSAPALVLYNPAPRFPCSLAREAFGKNVPSES